MKYLIAVAGLIGSGKSTVANELSRGLDAVIYNTDDLRGRNANVEYSKTKYQTDKETEKKKQTTYTLLFDKAKGSLAAGHSVILDANFSKRKWREQARRVAEELSVLYSLIEVICSDESAVRERIDERYKKDPSTTPYSVRENQPFDRIQVFERNFQVDTASELEKQIKDILREIRK